MKLGFKQKRAWRPRHLLVAGEGLRLRAVSAAADDFEANFEAAFSADGSLLPAPRLARLPPVLPKACTPTSALPCLSGGAAGASAGGSGGGGPGGMVGRGAPGSSIPACSWRRWYMCSKS